MDCSSPGSSVHGILQASKIEILRVQNIKKRICFLLLIAYLEYEKNAQWTLKMKVFTIEFYSLCLQIHVEKWHQEGRVFFIYACRGHLSCQGCVRGVLVHSAMQPSTQVCLQGQAYGSGKVTDAVDHEGLWKEGVLIKLASLSSALYGPGWNKHWPHLARPSLQPNQQVTIPRLQFQCQLCC